MSFALKNKLTALVFASLLAIAGCERSTQTVNVLAENTASDNTTTVDNTMNASFSTRLTTPRIPPLAEEGRTPEQVAMLASRPDYNLYKTLAHHVELYDRWTPLGRVLLNGSTLPARDREIIMLRMGWLCQAEYEWSQHARIATADNIGMTDEEVHRIAADPDAESWTEFERTLMDMVDELRYDAIISHATLQKLNAQYTQQEVSDALFTAAQYQLVSMVLNSTGIQLDPILEHRLPTDIPKPTLAGDSDPPRVTEPRIPPLTVDQLTAEQKEIAAGQIREDGTMLNLYGTMINHPALYGPRYTFGSYILRDSSLPADVRELLIMRTGWLLRAEYEWAHHVPYAKQAGLSEDDIQRIAAGPDAEGWSERDQAVLRAADELRREAFITDDTWATLEKHLDTKQLVELVFTVGGYTMTGLAINSFGIQVEEAFEVYSFQSTVDK